MTLPVRRLLSLLIAVFCWLSPSVAGADSVVLQPVRDATLFKDAEGDTASGSGTGLFTGNNGAQNTRRAVVAFDLDGAIPAGSTIDAVELRLHLDSAPNPDTVTITVHRVLSSWGEGASVSEGGKGVPAEPGDATWLHRFYPDSLWISPGGDFDPSILAATDVGSEASHSWAGAGMVSSVQDWLDNPSTNHGWMLRGVETGLRTVRRFYSREHDVEAERPELVVSFTPGGVPARPTTWGRLKQRWLSGLSGSQSRGR